MKPSEKYMIPWRGELEARIDALEDKLAGQKPLTFLDPECNTHCTASLEQKIERLIAYFERHSRENQKRSEKLDKELQTTLLSWTDYKRNEHSSYYLSGKSDAYQRAAEKLRELLGEPKWAGTKVTREVPKKPAEKWVIDMRSKGSNKSWLISGDSDVCGVFPSKAAAEEAIAHNGAVTVERRARRID